jgi:hypothetical protein
MQKIIFVNPHVNFINGQIDEFFSSSTMVLALDFERQNISLVTEQRLRSELTSFGLWPRSRCSVTK